MKFLCSNCKAKYQIPDEKIAGRTLKMDCRRCNTPITIRGDQPQADDVEAAPEEEPRPRAAAPAATSRARSTGTGTARPLGASASGSSVGAHPAASAASRSSVGGRSALGADFRRNIGASGASGAFNEAPRITPLDQWHVAINDVPVGPMKRDEIARKIAAGAANAESLAWREGFDDWRPIREIPELAALLRRATQESDRPAARPGTASRGPTAPAPRAPAPRAGVMPSPSARSPLGAAPAAARASARSNVVPIGGRLGASAAPTFDLEDGDDLQGEGEGETTTIASAADLGLGDFGRGIDRDDGEIPAPVARREEPKKEPIKPAGLTGGLKPIPPAARPIPAAAKPAAPAPAAKVAPVSKSAPTPAPKPAPVVAKPAPAPVLEPEPEEDDFGLPPVVEAPNSKTPSFAPPRPVATITSAPVVLAPSTPPPREERRRSLGVFPMMGIGFAMAAGAVLMYGVVQRFILSPPPPTTTVVATIATVAPPVTTTQVEAPVDDAPPPTTAGIPPASDVAPPATVATTASGTHHSSTSTTASGSTSGTPPTTRAARPAAPEDPRFAQFADDGAGPAPIATAATPHRDEDTPSHSSAELTSDQIGSVVRSGQRALTTCWETALRQAGHVDGDVRYNIDITIGTSGRVTSVNARGTAMANLQDCLERGVRRWVFPPSSSETQTTFPLVFSAQQ